MSGVSVATIKSPEFININSVSPLISKCEIKVLYVGQNRNRSSITKEIATKMAQTLPGTPIVGYYSENAEDYRDHGDQVTIDGDGLHFNCLTRPYGFVDLNTKIWFQEFEDKDEFGNATLREYLMCEGYLWTEQYEEAKKVISEGRPQSMELDKNSLKGHWSTDTNKGIDFFIISDATFSKLCILGQDVEPCFEGSAVTAPDVSANFSLEQKDFERNLYTMMKELMEYTKSEQGGAKMEDNIQVVEPATGEEVNKNFSNAEDKSGQTVIDKNQDTVEGTFEKKNDEEKKDNSDSEKDSQKEDSKENKEEPKDDEKDKENKTKHSLENDSEEDVTAKFEALQKEFSEMKEKFEALATENEALVNFKKEVEDKEKDELIKSFYMLSDEDKKDVIENKANYSLEDIESKLSVICVRKKVSFTKDEEEQKEEPGVLFNLNNTQADELPAWLKAVKDNRQGN